MRFREMFPAWARSSEEVASFYQTDIKKGLSKEEAAQRLKEFGPNELPKAQPPSLWRLFWRQFENPLIWLLSFAAFVSGMIGEWMQMGVIAAILILDVLISFYQEVRAEKEFEALRELFVPFSRVIRGGGLEQIPSREIVPGDLVSLEAGDRVPADARLVYVAQFAVQEAAVTGESVAIHKVATPLDEDVRGIPDRKNTVFLGTQIVSGRAIAVVTQTGKKTEIGHIASFLQSSSKEKTPMQGRLQRLSYHLLLLCLFLVALLFFLGIWSGKPWGEMFLMSLSLAVAAVPEGLPAIVTIALAVGVRKMVQRKALIRRLSSVETLGCATVICSDKTGTLTQNEMVVRTIWCGGREFQVGGIGYEPKGDFSERGAPIVPSDFPDLFFALQIGVLCNGAELIHVSEQGWKVQGDPTEGALLVTAAKTGLWKSALEEKFPLIEEVPFTPDRKRMSILRKEGRLFVKGAPDVLLRLSASCLWGGAIRHLDEPLRREISERSEELAQSGLRVLAFAYRDVKERGEGAMALEQELVFVALAAMIDPPRLEARQAIQKCREAHIYPMMITGDHKGTALAIAKEVGLAREGDLALEGKELDLMGEEALQKRVAQTAVYARVTAEHKMRIIEALKKRGEVVAMTGDGVNDAPALRCADIGISMGITGTDVAKETADMVLLDDRFSTLVHAIEEGRNVYDNIAKFMAFLLSANLAEVFTVFFGVIEGFTHVEGSFYLPLIPAQILWINLVTDGLPAIALAFDPLDPHTMGRKPRKKEESILPLRKGIQWIALGLVLATATLIGAFYGFQRGEALGQTIAFTTLVLLELVLVWLLRRPLMPHTNGKLLTAVVSSFLLQLCVLYFPPLQKAFGVVPLSWHDWKVVLGLTMGGAVLSFVVLQIRGKRKR